MRKQCSRSVEEVNDSDDGTFYSGKASEDEN